MLFYWCKFASITASECFRDAITYEDEVCRRFRVRALDCDGLRVMSAARYPVYMDFVRWTMLLRTRMLKVLLKHKVKPVLGAQKIIYRKPLKRWSDQCLRSLQLIEVRRADSNLSRDQRSIYPV